MRVAFDWSLQRSLGQQLVHLFYASNLVGGGIYSEHEHEDDGKEDSRVGAFGGNEIQDM